jgi:hypothetical protein
MYENLIYVSVPYGEFVSPNDDVLKATEFSFLVF